MEVLYEDGRRIVQWTHRAPQGATTVIRHDAPDRLIHFYEAPGSDEDVSLYAGPYLVVGDDRPFVGDVRLAWRPTPRVLARGGRAAEVSDLEGFLRDTGPSWVTMSTISLVADLPPLPEQPQGLEPPRFSRNSTMLSEQRLGDQSLGDETGLERVTFLIPNGWRMFDGRDVCDPSDRRRRWPGRMTAQGSKWRVTVDAIAEASSESYWKDRNASGGFGFTHIGELSAVNGRPFSAEEGQQALDAVRVALSLAIGRRTACLLPVGWRGAVPVWTSWRVPQVDPFVSVGTWLDEHVAAAQIAELLARTLDHWVDPVLRDVLRYATSYFLASNVDVNVELIVPTAVSGLLLLGHHRFVTGGSESHSRWKALSTEAQLRRLLDDCEIPSAVPPHFEHLESVRQTVEADADGPADALTCIARLRNHVAHPTRRQRATWGFIEWAEAGLVARHFLEHALLHTIGYTGATKPRTRGDGDPRSVSVPWV